MFVYTFLVMLETYVFFPRIINNIWKEKLSAGMTSNGVHDERYTFVESWSPDHACISAYSVARIPAYHKSTNCQR